MIPYSRQDVNQDDIDAVVEVLRSDYLTQGPTVLAFEQAVAKYCKARYAVATNSATSALHVACQALGVGRGDIVWTTPITFVASANCARYCGAKVDLVDIDPDTFNLDANLLGEKLAIAEKSGTLPKVVIPVHLCGQSCDMKRIHDLREKYGFKIIEDGSHAIGGKYRNEPIGSCQYSDITVFSFHPVKIITTGEGGMAITNDPELANTMAMLRSHGITRDHAKMTKGADGPWYYEQLELGYNYRMTDLYAALGLSQLKRLDKFVACRNELASNYDNLLQGQPFKIPARNVDAYSSFHLYVVRVKGENPRQTRADVFDRLRNNGIMANIHYIPIYHHPYYARLGFTAKNFPEAENYYDRALSIPLYPELTNAQQRQIVHLLKKPMGHQTIF